MGRGNHHSHLDYHGFFYIFDKYFFGLNEFSLVHLFCIEYENIRKSSQLTQAN